MELWLERINRRHVQAGGGEVPETFREFIDPATYAKSVDYTVAKSRFHEVEAFWNFVVLTLVLVSSVLPWLYSRTFEFLGTSAWAKAAFLFAVGLGLSLPMLPLDWYEKFKLEQRFGFNTSTVKVWLTDKVKGLALGIALGYPLIVLVLKLVDWTGKYWWLWAWGAILVFQLIVSVLAPVLILPLFNKFVPLPDGSLRARLMTLARRVGFKAQSIQVMDGSKRSLHSNAFFIGLGRFRKIVFFDTLLKQLDEPELEAVLAHEIAHYKKKHIVKMLCWSALSLLAGLYVANVLARDSWFMRGFGFQPGDIAPALLLFSLLSGAVAFWFSPLLHWWSRRYEYEADRYAAEVVGKPDDLVTALRKLTEKNLSNLRPHPAYSRFYYSHPTLVEREAALQELKLPAAALT